jgi:hypothetical protein
MTYPESGLIGRPRDQPPGVYPAGEPTEYLEGGAAILAALDAVAVAQRTGTAWLNGQNVGALHFRDGRVAGAELEGSAWCRTRLVASGRLSAAEWDEFERAWSRPPAEPRPGAPPVPGMSILEWSALALDGTVEAAFELLPADRGEGFGDMVFQPDRIPAWTGSGRAVALPWLSREIGRRQSVLDRLQPFLSADSVLVRAAPEWLGPVQVSAQQWRVLSALSDGSTARSVGRRTGLGTFAATLVARTLVQLGMITTPDAGDGKRPAGAAFPRTLFMDAVAPLR